MSNDEPAGPVPPGAPGAGNDSAEPREETRSEVFARGAAFLAALSPEGAVPPWDALAGVAPVLGRQVALAFGDVVSRPGLDVRTRELATVAMLAVLGGTEPQIAFHVGGALRAGATSPEVVELITQVSVYAGIPRALNALGAARPVFEEFGGHAGEPAPRAVVAEVLAAARGGDGESALRAFADDATVALPAGVAGPQPLSFAGKESIGRWLRSLSGHLRSGRVELGEPLPARDRVILSLELGQVEAELLDGQAPALPGAGRILVEWTFRDGLVTGVVGYGQVQPVGQFEPEPAALGVHPGPDHHHPASSAARRAPRREEVAAARRPWERTAPPAGS
jgi:4-carboxymuconolactone decarboxylase